MSTKTTTRKHAVFLLYTDSYRSEIPERIEKYIVPEADPDISKREPLFKGNKNRISKRFLGGAVKDTESSFKAKMTKHGKKKNSKCESGNIPLKHIFLSVYNLAQKGASPLPPGSAYEYYYITYTCIYIQNVLVDLSQCILSIL